MVLVAFSKWISLKKSFTRSRTSKAQVPINSSKPLSCSAAAPVPQQSPPRSPKHWSKSTTICRLTNIDMPTGQSARCCKQDTYQASSACPHQWGRDQGCLCSISTPVFNTLLGFYTLFHVWLQLDNAFKCYQGKTNSIVTKIFLRKPSDQQYC